MGSVSDGPSRWKHTSHNEVALFLFVLLDSNDSATLHHTPYADKRSRLSEYHEAKHAQSLEQSRRQEGRQSI